MKTPLQEVTARLEALAAEHPHGNLELAARYHGADAIGLRTLGLMVPMQRAAVREGYSFLRGSQREVARAWDGVWRKSDCYEVMAQPLFYYAHKARRDQLTARWPLLREWSRRAECWPHADTLCGIYATILEAQPDRVLPTLEKWNRGRSPWRRRLSIVSLIYYASARERVLPFKSLIPLVERQVGYDHLFVQKGVGWTLRELGNLYPKPTWRWLQANATRLSATAYSAAVEKRSRAERDALKAARKAARKM
jgi:3-methyladenine DNA glycosylase AlkD